MIYADEIENWKNFYIPWFIDARNKDDLYIQYDAYGYKVSSEEVGQLLGGN